MKNQNGVTLIFLVMTVILIMILASIVTYTGAESYENMKVQIFVSKMITVQEAVDKLCEKYTVPEINEMGLSYTSAPTEATNVLNEVIANSDSLTSWTSTVDNNLNNYRYFDTNNINTILGIKNFDTAIWINPTSRNIIAVKGVMSEEVMHYRQYDLSGGQTLPEPNINVSFALSYSVKTYDNKAEIILQKNATETTFTEVKYYKKLEGTEEYSDARMLNNVSKITLNESGTYKVEATDSTGNTQSQEGIIITIVNKPLLVDGMTPIKFNGSEVIETTATDQEWYNYGNDVKNWANAKLKDGSIYVWIPRFAYEIDATNQQINIKFLKDFSTVGTDGKAMSSSYRIAPAFQSGVSNNFSNGEWDNIITGFWIAKYETTQNDGKPQNTLIAEECWRSIAPNDAFNLCRSMEADYKETYFGEKVTAATGEYKYGEYETDENNIDTHLIKNSEWGAVAYLTHSKYGVQNKENKQVDKCESYYIRNAADEGNSAVKFSTTENYTGVYGLNGGAHDLVSAGLKFVYTDENGNEQNCFNYEDRSTKYATLYTTGNISDTTNSVHGDAMKETYGWLNNLAYAPSELICRGGIASATAYTGIFAFQNKSYLPEDTVTFRPVLIVEY